MVTAGEHDIAGRNAIIAATPLDTSARDAADALRSSRARHCRAACTTSRM